ncbi:MAG TPA: transglycosylase SLT domain-containing protein [Acidobacteriaceae bacterium]
MALFFPDKSTSKDGCSKVRDLASRIALVGCIAATLTGCPDSQQPSPNVSKPTTTAPPVQATAPAPAPVKPNTPATPQQKQAQQRTAQVIAQADRYFASGQAHYRKGELTQAKADFDSAVDGMLASGLDIKADPQLEDEFNQILDAVNALEMEALKQGNGFAPAQEPTPADVANDVTFEVDPNIVAKAKSELATTKSDLPLVINDYVATYIKFFANTQKGHNTLKHSLQRSGRYRAMISRVMADEGVPQDLIYLAVAESGFQPQVVNRGSGAGGMWQFMPNDKYYGLARNAYVDERFDPEKATRATAKYMKFIYNQLGDWYLAMAGYNWGTGSVQRAVQKTGFADFWELYKRNNLPEQTKNYVPEIIAAAIIAKNPTQYGFDDLVFDQPIVYETVPINYQVDLRLIADILDVQPQEIAELNPSLLRMSTPPPALLNEPFDLHLPPGTATLYRERIALIPEERRNQWRYHRIEPDETLTSVARSYHVSVEQLASVNQLSPGDSLADVEALVVPVAPPPAVGSRAETYKARRGDTLVKIADRFGVSLEDLRRWNHLSGATVSAGQRIRVSEPASAAARSAAHGGKSKSNVKTTAKSNAHGAGAERRHASAADEKRAKSAKSKADSSSAKHASNLKGPSKEQQPRSTKNSSAHGKGTSNTKGKKNIEK